MGVVQLVRVNVVEVGVFFILEVIQVGYLLFHFRVEISTHLFLPLSPLMCLHLLINELGLLHAFQEGHHFGFDHLDFVLVFHVELFTLFRVFREELIFVTEGMVEDELGEVEEVRILVIFLLKEPHCPGEGSLVQDPGLSWHDICQSQKVWQLPLPGVTVSNYQVVEVILLSEFTFFRLLFVIIRFLFFTFLIGFPHVLPAFSLIHLDKLAERQLLQFFCLLIVFWHLLPSFQTWQQLSSLILADEVWLLQEAALLVLDLKPLATVWVLALEELSSLAFWLSGHKDGGNAGVGHLHVGEELVDGLRLSYLTMSHELVGHLVTFLPHVFVIAKLPHRSFEDFCQTSAVLKVTCFIESECKIKFNQS